MALPVLISLFTCETVANILLHGKVDEKELEFALTLVRLVKWVTGTCTAISEKWYSAAVINRLSSKKLCTSATVPHEYKASLNCSASKETSRPNTQVCNPRWWNLTLLTTHLSVVEFQETLKLQNRPLVNTRRVFKLPQFSRWHYSFHVKKPPKHWLPIIWCCSTIQYYNSVHERSSQNSPVLL